MNKKLEPSMLPFGGSFYPYPATTGRKEGKKERRKEGKKKEVEGRKNYMELYIYI
jgi:hypothetical protein